MSSTQTRARAFLALCALSVTCAGWGCVADRPSRNGVFNENQYVRKDFLIRPGDSTVADQGWFFKATVMEASEPNVFGNANVFGLFAGSHNLGDLVHFVVTQDKLEMVNSREINGIAAPAGLTNPVGRTAETVNAWPVTNVDLKYRINLDGEKTNFYEENQELPWDTRQWVKLQFAKNDMSDLAPLGSYYAQNVDKCTDVLNTSATLVPNSFVVDEPNDYIEWQVQIVLPFKTVFDSDSQGCPEAYGAMGADALRLGRNTETITLKYSLTRAKASTYAPMAVTEKDPIRRKYGPITFTTWNRDPVTQLLTGTEYVVRFDPTKPVKWYFEQGFPDEYKKYFTSTALPTGQAPLPDGIPTIEQATNDLLAASGAPAAMRVSFQEWNAPDANGNPVQRRFGDIRYNMLRFVQTYDQQSSFAGIMSPIVDPRTGENLSTDIVFDNFTIKDYYVARIDAYLRSVGASPQNKDGTFGIYASAAEWADPVDPATGQPLVCGTVGQSIPIVPSAVISNHNGLSSLYQKIQQYLYKPVSENGALGPQDFIKPQDDDFRAAYFSYVPYLVYGDPELNQFVYPEGGAGTRNAGEVWQKLALEKEFHDTARSIERGQMPYDPNSPNRQSDAFAFLDRFKALTLNHRDLRYTLQSIHMRPGIAAGQSLAYADAVTDFAIESVMQKDARHCVNTGGSLHWETKQEWQDSLISTYWSQVFWHEFGHAMGLGHNFMASVDKPNFVQNGKNPDGTNKYALYASSVMEYNAVPDRVFWGAGWGAYDKGAISWIYGNPSGKKNTTAPTTATVPQGISGQYTATYPWNDPAGFDAAGNERQFLYCDERHTRYTPLCRPGDLGTTPSEITANDIEMYEWQYQWRNFRQYRKVWDDSAYADGPMNFLTEGRRFLSMWAFDLSPSEVTQALQRIGVNPPRDAPSAQFYYQQLTNKFTDEMAHAAALSSAVHEALVQQSSGQRPYITLYDTYYGDVTQQGIALDKYFAILSFTSLWPIDNYDLNQATGLYIGSYSPFGFASETNGTGIGALYQTIGESAVNSMIGGSYDAFAFYKEDAVAQFAWDTHSVNFTNQIAGAARNEVRDWLGGYLFYRLDDFLAYFHDLADQVGYVNTSNKIDCGPQPAAGTTCSYDPRTPRAYQEDVQFSDVYNEFLGPDGRRYIWVYVPDRNQWVVADRDRNTATYQILRNYTTDVVLQKDDGNYGGPAFRLQTQVKYFIDYYLASNSQPH